MNKGNFRACDSVWAAFIEGEAALEGRGGFSEKSHLFGGMFFRGGDRGVFCHFVGRKFVNWEKSSAVWYNFGVVWNRNAMDGLEPRCNVRLLWLR